MTASASQLLQNLPHSTFLPITDKRIAGTIAAIERDLKCDGFVMRYRSENTSDGLAPGEGAFLACSFWLADAYMLQKRWAEAKRLFGRLLDLRNDVGLLSEEYDPSAQRLVGNFPQAFSHVALINSAYNLMAETSEPQGVFTQQEETNAPDIPAREGVG